MRKRIKTISFIVLAALFINITKVPVFAAPEDLEIVTNGMPSAKVGTSYSKTLSAKGGVTPYVWSQEGLPEGFGLDSVTGEVYGISAAAITTPVRFTVTDSVYGSFIKDMNFTVNPAYPSTPFVQGGGYSDGAYDENAAQPTTTNWTRQSRFTGTAEGELKWTYDSDAMFLHSSPAIGEDGTIYIGDNGSLSGLDSSLIAVNPDGTLKWKYIAEDIFRSDPVIAEDGTIFAASNDGRLYAINPDGTLKWFYDTAEYIFSSPAIGRDGTIYFGSCDKKLHAVNPDGTSKWSFATGGNVSSSPAIASDDTIYVGSDDGILYALEPDGTLKWSFDPIGYIDADPVIGADGTIYFGSYDIDENWNYSGRIYAVSPDGEELWSYYAEYTTYGSLAIGADDTLYFGSQYRFIALHPDGKLKWETTIPEGIIFAPIIGADGIIYAGADGSWEDPDAEHKLYAFNTDGTIVWVYNADGSISSSPSIGADGTIYFTTMLNDKLYALYKPLVFDTASLPGGKANEAYNYTLSASGGTPPYTWSADDLPAGLSINADTAEIYGTPTIAGTSTINFSVTDNMGAKKNRTLTLIISGGVNKDEDDDDDRPSAPSQKPAGPVPDPVEGDIITSVPKLDSSTGVASAEVKADILEKAFNSATEDEMGLKTVELIISGTEGATRYEPILPTSFFEPGDDKKAIEIRTDHATVTVPGNMLAQAEIAGVQNVSMTIEYADKDKLDPKLRSQIGERPVIELSLKLDGKTIAWNSDSAFVSVSVPYIPTADELKDPEHITVWYIDGSGNVTAVSNGRYDAAAGTVTFNTNHLSRFAVVFVKKSFTDINDYQWARKQIEVLASKGIIRGVSETTYNPSENISRADFLALLVRALALTAEIDSNFSDVKPSYYYYEELGVAKSLGISTGVGNNLFMPKDPISRQDMITLAVRAMQLTGNIKAAGDVSSLNRFSDKENIHPYAMDAIAAMVKEGMIKGDGSRINPAANTTRAEIAVFMYRIYNKQ